MHRLHLITLSVILLALPLITFSQSIGNKSKLDVIEGLRIGNDVSNMGQSMTVNDISSINKSGDLFLNVPLTEIKGRKLTLPLQLNYQSGIKVDQRSGPVGLGWSLGFGSITRDYGAFEPDYTATDGEIEMLNTDGSIYDAELSVLEPAGKVKDPMVNGRSLEYATVSGEGMFPDIYHLNLPGVGSNSFWNKGSAGASHDFVFSDKQPLKLEFDTKVYEIAQEFSRINEYNSNNTGSNVISYDATYDVYHLDYYQSFASAIGLLPYVKERSTYPAAHEPCPSSNFDPSGEDYQVVKYEDFKSFTITSADGTRYVFGRALRGQKYMFSEDPFWSTTQDNCDATAGSGSTGIYGDWWKMDYIAEWLLTEVLSVDYEDTDGISGPSDGDKGDWIRIEYTKKNQYINSLIGSTVSQSTAPLHREWLNYTQTDQYSSLMRERAYVTRIITPVQQVEFNISKRYDIYHDYFPKAFNYIGNPSFYAYNNLVFDPTTIDHTAFNVKYPVETMKYDKLVVKRRYKQDKVVFGDDPILTTIKLNYAEKGSSSELAVSDYVINNYHDEYWVEPLFNYDPSDYAGFDVEDYYTTSYSRGKTTLLSVEFYPGDNESDPSKRTYSFDYDNNPSFTNIHKTEIIQTRLFPTVRQSNMKVKRNMPSSVDFNSTSYSPYDLISLLPWQSNTYRYNFDYTDLATYFGSSGTNTSGKGMIATPQNEDVVNFKDEMGYYYNGGANDRAAWSLTKVTVPEGGTITFTYENDSFDYTNDKAEWQFDDNNIPVINQYNDLAKQKSLRQNAVNRLHVISDTEYNTWLANSSILEPKRLTAAYEFPLSSSTGGIRLKTKIIDDQINSTQTTTYTYGTGHFTALPGDWLSNYFNGFSVFITHENHRHSDEEGFYENMMYSWYPSWVSDFYEYMAHRLKNFRVDASVDGQHFYESITETYNNGSKIVREYGDASGTSSGVYYPDQKMQIIRYHGNEIEPQVFVLTQDKKEEAAPMLLSTKYYENSAGSPYKTETFEYEFSAIHSKSLNTVTWEIFPGQTMYNCAVLDAGLGADCSHPIPASGNYPENFDLLSTVYTSNGTTLNSRQIWGNLLTGGANCQESYVQIEDLKFTTSDYDIPAASSTYRYSLRTRLSKKTTEYKGLTAEEEYDYDATYGLLQTTTVKNSSYNTGSLFDEEVQSNNLYGYEQYGSDFTDLYYLSPIAQVTTSLVGEGALSSTATTWNVNGSVPVPERTYILNDEINEKGVISGSTTFNFSNIAANDSRWEFRNIIEKYNKFYQLSLEQLNQSFYKTVWGYNYTSPKALINFTERPFDATYTGFEEITYNLQTSDFTTQTEEEEEFWYEQNDVDHATSGYGFTYYYTTTELNTCGTGQTAHRDGCISATSYVNVIDVGNIYIFIDNSEMGLVAGDEILIKPDPLDPLHNTLSEVTVTIASVNSYSPDAGYATNLNNLTSKNVDYTGFDSYICLDALLPEAWRLRSHPCGSSTYYDIPQLFDFLVVKNELSRKSGPTAASHHTGDYAYLVDHKDDVPDPAQKSPVRPVEIPAFSAWESLCIDPTSPDPELRWHETGLEILFPNPGTYSDLDIADGMINHAIYHLSNLDPYSGDPDFGSELNTYLHGIVDVEVVPENNYEQGTTDFNERALEIGNLIDNSLQDFPSNEFPSECTFTYLVGLWATMFDPNAGTTGPPTGMNLRLRPVTGGTTGDFRYGEFDNEEQEYDIRLKWEIWNSNFTSKLQEGSQYFKDLNDRYQYYELEIPAKKRSVKTWLVAYVVNYEIKPESPTLPKKLYIDDMIICPKGSYYTYNSQDLYGNLTWISNTNQNSRENRFDAWGRPWLVYDYLNHCISGHSYSMPGITGSRHNYISSVNHVNSGFYNNQRSFFDGFGKHLETMVTEPRKNLSIITGAKTYNNMGNAEKVYLDFAVVGTNLPYKSGISSASSKTIVQYQTNYGFLKNNYYNYPEAVIYEKEFPKSNSSSVIKSQVEDDATTSSVSINIGSKSRSYAAGELLVTESRDALNNLTTVWTDKAGRVVANQNSIGNAHTQGGTGAISFSGSNSDAITLYHYDAAGNLIRIKDPSGIISEMTYNSLGNIVSTSHPDNGKQEYRYDTFGRLRFYQDQKSFDITGGTFADQFHYFIYDKRDRLIESGMMHLPTGQSAQFDDPAYIDLRTYPRPHSLGAAIHRKYTYDGERLYNLQVALVKEEIFSSHSLHLDGYYTPGTSDSVIYSYDRNGRIREKIFRYNGLSDGHSMVYNYTTNGAIEQIAYSNPVDTNYNFVKHWSYDDLGRVKKTESGILSTTLTEDQIFYYDALGQLCKKFTSPTGQTTGSYREYSQYNYDQRGLMDIHVSNKFKNVFKHDLNGNITAQYWNNSYQDNTGGGSYELHLYDYYYDNMNRLAGADYSTVTEISDPFSTVESSLDNIPVPVTYTSFTYPADLDPEDSLPDIAGGDPSIKQKFTEDLLNKMTEIEAMDFTVVTTLGSLSNGETFLDQVLVKYNIAQNLSSGDYSNLLAAGVSNFSYIDTEVGDLGGPLAILKKIPEELYDFLDVTITNYPFELDEIDTDNEKKEMLLAIIREINVTSEDLELSEDNGELLLTIEELKKQQIDLEQAQSITNLIEQLKVQLPENEFLDQVSFEVEAVGVLLQENVYFPATEAIYTSINEIIVNGALTDEEKIEGIISANVGLQTQLGEAFSLYNGYLWPTITSFITLNTSELANRLDKNNYIGGTVSTSNLYDMAGWYTSNGNITSLSRNDDSGVKTEQDYSYGSGTNKLSSVGLTIGGSGPTAYNYVHDANGNVTTEGLNSLTMNYGSFTQMPLQIVGSSTINYRYDASGMRLHRHFNTGQDEFFLDDVILDGDNELPIHYAFSGGFATNDGTSLQKSWNVSDWLGSPRLVFDATGVSATRDHYPFGKLMPGRTYSSQLEDRRYQFTGHHYDEDIELGYHGARYYNRELGRYLGVDPLATDVPSWSPFRYGFDNPINYFDPTGLFEDNYSVDDDGKVTLEEETGDEFDMLYTKSDWDAGNMGNGLKVNDRSILPDLAQSRSDFNGNYAIGDNKSELFNVFYFAANNTNVEWGIDGYRTSGPNEYILRTSHKEDAVTMSKSLSRYSMFNLIFNVHSHPDSDGTKGGSGDFGGTFMGDMANITSRYYRFRDAGMTNINTWFKVDGKYTIFPKHYVYHKESKTFYHYTPWESSIFIRKTNKGNDLYRNLGF